MKWPRLWDLAICLALLLATFKVYAPVRDFEFVNYDDPEFVRDNPHVRAGLTREGVAWAFTSTESANWFPLTRLSQMLDVQLWGMRPEPQHLTNVLLHALAAMCLFAFLRRATQARWLSGWVALLFALHPLHVESVAWIAERKDVLCALFWFLSLWAWVWYTERPGAGRYLLALGAFCLGLMSKPMIVTLPVLLLLVDFWPLRRRAGWREKLPFFALSGVASIAIYLVQQHSGAVGALALYPLGLRVENALLSYVVYIGKVFWPTRLAVFYPYPQAIPWPQTVLAVLALAAITALVVRFARACPYLAVGWFWYLFTLAPVIGLVQVGAQARADRYLYVPLVGLAIVLVWGGAQFLSSVRCHPLAAAYLAGAVCVVYAVVASAYVWQWHDSQSLFIHALRVTRLNYVAYNNLGNAQAALPGGLPEAVRQYQAALRIWPEYAEAHNNLGTAWAQTPGRLPDAVAEFEAALRVRPEFAEAHFNLANVLAQTPGRGPDAIREYQAALRIQPDHLAAHVNFGTMLLRTPGRAQDAIAEYRAALQLDPRSAEAHNNLGTALAQIPGSLPDAIAEYEAALQANPRYAQGHYNLANALAAVGRQADAIAEYQAAVRANPNLVDAHYNLAVTLTEMGRLPEAIAEYEAALRLAPGSTKIQYNLGVVLLKAGRQQQALPHLEAVLRAGPNPAVQRVVDKLRAK